MEVEQALKERVKELRDELARHEKALEALQPPKAKANGEKTTRRRRGGRTKQRPPSDESIETVRTYMLEHRGQELQPSTISDDTGVGASTVTRVLKTLSSDADGLVKHNGKGGAYSRYMIPAQEDSVPETPAPETPAPEVVTA